jgi:cytochrome c oxidase assembly protein subunit 20
MGWWPFSRGSIDQTQQQGQQQGQEQPRKQQLFIDDVPPKYAEASTVGVVGTSTGTGTGTPQQYSVSKEVRAYLSTLTLEQFMLSNLVQIPCFRDAGLAGFSCFFVFSSVIYVYHRSIRRAANWGFGGLLLGSIFGWEQCNNQRRQGQMAVKLAQQRFENKTNNSTEKDN